MYPKAIFFDLDDTIIAFEPVARIAWQSVCRAFVEKTTGFDEQKLLSSISELAV